MCVQYRKIYFPHFPIEHALVLFHYDMFFFFFSRFHSAHTNTTEHRENDAKFRPCPSVFKQHRKSTKYRSRQNKTA